MNRKTNFIILISGMILYILNTHTKHLHTIPFLYWFMNCYFNDFVGGVTFITYTNIVLSYKKIAPLSLPKILLLLLFCGFCWEVITPLFKKNSVLDIWDFVAYEAGGILYWMINFAYIKLNHTTKKA